MKGYIECSLNHLCASVNFSALPRGTQQHHPHLPSQCHPAEPERRRRPLDVRSGEFVVSHGSGGHRAQGINGKPMRSKLRHIPHAPVHNSSRVSPRVHRRAHHPPHAAMSAPSSTSSRIRNPSVRHRLRQSFRPKRGVLITSSFFRRTVTADPANFAGKNRLHAVRHDIFAQNLLCRVRNGSNSTCQKPSNNESAPAPAGLRELFWARTR